ncbi:MAG: hypothetical protein N2C14_16650, partial [Planctomycetales bacterium]
WSRESDLALLGCVRKNPLGKRFLVDESPSLFRQTNFFLAGRQPLKNGIHELEVVKGIVQFK